MWKRWWLWTVLCVGCAPPVDDRAYVLLDREAREAGLTLEVEGWRGAPVLPLALGDEAIELSGPDGSIGRLLPVRGRLTWLRGAFARRDELEIDPDHLLLDADDASAAQLAELVEGRLVRGQKIQLVAEALYTRTTFLDVPEGVREAMPVGSTTAAPVAGPELVPASRVASGRGGPVSLVRAPGLPELVGAWAHGNRLLVIDGDGGASLESSCDVEARGHIARDGDELVLSSDDGAPLHRFVVSNGALADDTAQWTPLAPEGDFR